MNTVNTLGDTHFTRMLTDASDAWCLRGDRGTTERLYLAALALADDMCRTEGPSAAAYARAALAEFYRCTARYDEAEALFLQALALMQEADLEAEDNFTIVVIGLATLYLMLGKYAQAEALACAALASQERALGRSHPQVSLTLSRLGYLYDVQGQHAKAEDFLRRAISGWESSFSLVGISVRYLPHYVDAVGQLGGLYRRQGRGAEAEWALAHALNIAEPVLGPEHPVCVKALDSLAQPCLVDHDLDAGRAEQLLLRSLEIRKRTFGAHHPEVAAQLGRLGGFYLRQGDYSRSEELAEQSAAIYEACFGPDHPSLAIQLTGLAAVYQAQERYAEAVDYFERARVILDKTLGADHPDVATIVSNLGVLCHLQNQYRQAEAYYRQSLAVLNRVLQPGHPRLLGPAGNYALLLRELGRDLEAAAIETGAGSGDGQFAQTNAPQQR